MTSIESFLHRVAVVTGAASGIGQGIAASLVSAGATVIASDIDGDGAERAARAMGAHARQVDVTNPSSVQALADGVISDFGRVDILVNNAGVGPLSAFDDLTTADFEWVMDINFWGVIHGIKSFLPLLIANPHGGYIVNTASVAALFPAPGTAAYAASKAAVVAVSETLALELSDRARVGISILLPALVRSNITVNARKRPGYHAGGPRTEDFLPPGRALEPSQVGEMVIAAMRAGDRYIFTHPETRPPVEERYQVLLNAYARRTAEETGGQVAESAQWDLPAPSQLPRERNAMESRGPATTSAPDAVRPAPDPSLTAEDVLQAAEDLVPLLRERAVAADRSRRIEVDTFRRLQDAGFFHILKPKKYGGLELSEHEHAKVAMTLARGCASTAWVVSILSSDNMAILAFPEQVQEEVWGRDTYATLAGNTNVNPKAKAVRVPGGYRLTGSWGFCSGSDFSEWLIFNAPAGDAGEGHMFIVPREDTTVIDDWFPTGMRGTGSRTMAVEDVFVPGHRVQATRDTVQKLQERRALHPTFDAMYAHWPSNGRFPFASTAVGAAWGAVEHFAATVASGTRVANALGGTVRLADQDYVASELAEAAGEVQMAMLLIEKRSFESAERARQRRGPSETELARDARDNALVTRVALRSVQRIYSLVGSKAGNPEHPVSLAKRDVEMVSHHVTLNWRQSAVRYLAAAAKKDQR